MAVRESLPNLKQLHNAMNVIHIAGSEAWCIIVDDLGPLEKAVKALTEAL